MKANSIATTGSYAAAYAQSSQIAEELKTAGAAASIDDLVDKLKAARVAYSTCKMRLDAIRREVDAEVEAASEVTSRN